MDIVELSNRKNELIELRKEIITIEDNDKLLFSNMDKYSEDFTSNISLEAKSEIRIRNGLSNLSYMKNALLQELPISENMVKDMHQILMEDIMPGGIYRNLDVRISNTDFIPPSPVRAYQDIKYFFYLLEEQQKCENSNPIYLSAFSLVEMLSIHPFVNGNGRVARATSNYSLLEEGFFPIVFAKTERNEYIDRIEECRKYKRRNRKLEEIYLPVAEFLSQKQEQIQEDVYRKIKKI